MAFRALVPFRGTFELAWMQALLRALDAVGLFDEARPEPLRSTHRTAFSWGRSKLPISGAPLVWAPLAVVGL